MGGVCSPTTPHWQDVTQGQFFKKSITSFKSVFLLQDWLLYQD